MRKIWGIGVLLALGLAGCASEGDPQYVIDGVQYGVTQGTFRGRWWSYYERGASFLAGGFYAEAADDFREALAGRRTDSWRARTYGLRFVEYFPNRELGVALYYQGELAEAEERLQASLTEVDTERAHFFLDEILKARIETGEITDADGPTIVSVALAPVEVEAGAPDRRLVKPGILSEIELPVAVVTQDDVAVAEVRINDEPVYQRGAAEAVDTVEEVVLEEGPQTVAIAARDIADKETVEEIDVVVDLTGPTIGVFQPIEPTITEAGDIQLEGASVDDNGVAAVEVDDRVVAESDGEPRLAFADTMPLSDGENTFVVASRDVVGNETRSGVRVFRGDPASFTALDWLRRQYVEQRILLADTSSRSLGLVLAAAHEDPSEVRIKSPVPGEVYRHNRTVRLSGEVVSTHPVTSLTINGVAFSPLTGAPKESFNRRIPVPPLLGDAEPEPFGIAIAATDASGAAIAHTIEVMVEPVQVRSSDTHMPVALLAFEANGVDPDLLAQLRASTIAAMQADGRFRAVSEHGVAESGLTESQWQAGLQSADEALGIGRLTASHVYLVADAYPREAGGLELRARAIDTRTGDLIHNLDVFVPDPGDAVSRDVAARNLVAQLFRLYPRIFGQVTAVSGNTARVDWTHADGIREGAMVLFLREAAALRDEATGELIEPGELVEVARGRVRSVSNSEARVIIEEQGDTDASVEAGISVLTM